MIARVRVSEADHAQRIADGAGESLSGLAIGRLRFQAGERLPRRTIDSCGTLFVIDGVLVIEGSPARKRLQILDFLQTGDSLALASFSALPGLAVRTITDATIDFSPGAHDGSVSGHSVGAADHAPSRQIRAYIHHFMLGHLDAEERVASWLLMAAERSHDASGPEPLVSLPMSRDDIANYLVINPDTLCRLMARLAALGVIAWQGPRAVRIIDLAELRRKTPLAALIAASYEQGRALQSSSRKCQYSSGAAEERPMVDRDTGVSGGHRRQRADPSVSLDD